MKLKALFEGWRQRKKEQEALWKNDPRLWKIDQPTFHNSEKFIRDPELLVFNLLKDDQSGLTYSQITNYINDYTSLLKKRGYDIDIDDDDLAIVLQNLLDNNIIYYEVKNNIRTYYLDTVETNIGNNDPYMNKFKRLHRHGKMADYLS